MSYCLNKVMSRNIGMSIKVGKVGDMVMSSDIVDIKLCQNFTCRDLDKIFFEGERSETFPK
jgi:hypothetical protein